MLKTRPSSDGESPLRDPWSGLWGSVVPDMKSLSMLRVELPSQNGKQETHAFAYSSLSRWVFCKSEKADKLEMHFGGWVVSVQGTGLEPLITALEEGRLKLIRACTLRNDEVPMIESLMVRHPEMPSLQP